MAEGRNDHLYTVEHKRPMVIQHTARNPMGTMTPPPRMSQYYGQQPPPAHVHPTMSSSIMSSSLPQGHPMAMPVGPMPQLLSRPLSRDLQPGRGQTPPSLHLTQAPPPLHRGHTPPSLHRGSPARRNSPGPPFYPQKQSSPASFMNIPAAANSPGLMRLLNHPYSGQSNASAPLGLHIPGGISQPSLIMQERMSRSSGQHLLQTYSKPTAEVQHRMASNQEPPKLSPHTSEIDFPIKIEPFEEKVAMPSPFNMRLVNLSNFPTNSSYRSSYRSQAVAIHRAKSGSITSAAKSLDLLRQNIQKVMNKEIDTIIQKYLDQFFKVGIENIKLNNGENAVCEEHVNAVCRQVLEEAKKMYTSETRARSITPLREISDNASEAGSTNENSHRHRVPKVPFGHLRKRGSDTDSEAGHPVRKKKKGKYNHSGRGTPSKPGKIAEPIRRQGPKWDPERLTTDTVFVMGARANKALGLGATRGRLYIKHPQLFKYSGDQDDKQWLYENHRMPATGGKAYMLVVEDIQQLAETDEYRNNPGLVMDQLDTGFLAPDWMLEKMKVQMISMRTNFATEAEKKVMTTQAAKEEPNDEDPDNSTDVDDSDKNVPFTSAEGSKKTLTDVKMDESQVSPANTEEMDLMSNGEQGDASPFNMTGGFDSRIPPTLSPGSDLDDLEIDPPPTAGFSLS